MRVILPLLLVMSFSVSADETLKFIMKESEATKANLTEALAGICEAAAKDTTELLECKKVVRNVSDRIFELGQLYGKAEEKLNEL